MRQRPRGSGPDADKRPSGAGTAAQDRSAGAHGGGDATRVFAGRGPDADEQTVLSLDTRDLDLSTDVPTAAVALPGAGPSRRTPETVEPSLLALDDPTLGAIPQSALPPQRDDSDSRIRPLPRAAVDSGTLRLSAPAAPSGHSGTMSLLGRSRRPGLRALQSRDARKQSGPRAPILPLRAVLLICGALCIIIVVGTLMGRKVRRLRVTRLFASATADAEEARRRGALKDLRAAARHFEDLLDLLPAHGPALAARAHLLAEAAYEFGGPAPTAIGAGDAQPGAAAVLPGAALPGAATAPGAGDPDARAGDPTPAPPDESALPTQAERAVRLIQAETDTEARAALAYQGLQDADLPLVNTQVEALAHDAAAPAGLAPYLRAQVALYQGQDDQALRLLDEAVRAQPSWTLWRVRLAQRLALAGRKQEAAAALAEAQAKNPTHVGALLERALGLVAREPSVEAHKSAEATLTRLIKDRGESTSSEELARAQLYLGRLPLLPGTGEAPDLRAVRRHLGEAQAALTSFSLPLCEELADVMLRARDLAGAERQAQRVLAKAPARDGARLVLAEALLARNQGEEALTVLAPLSGHPGVAQRYLLLRARALLQLDQTLDAQLVAQQAEGTAHSPEERLDARLLQARILLQLGDLAEARQIVEPLLSTAPPVAVSQGQRMEAQLLLSLLHLSARPPQRTEAQAGLEWLVLHAPQMTEAHLALGRLLREGGQERAALVQFEAALQIEDVPAARRELAGLAMELHDIALARRHYDALLSGAEDTGLLIAAARAYRASGDPRGALRLLSRVRHHKGDADEDVIIERGRALLALDQSAEALTLLTDPARGARRAAIPALLIRAQLQSDPGEHGQRRARAVLENLPESFRRDPDVQLAEVRLLLTEGKAPFALRGAEALVERLGHLHLGGEEEVLRSLARQVMTQAEQAHP